MKRYTIKDLRKFVEFFNEYLIASTEYKIKAVPMNGHYYLYLRHQVGNRNVCMLFAGTAKECKTYLEGMRAGFWYFYKTNDLPF